MEESLMGVPILSSEGGGMHGQMEPPPYLLHQQQHDNMQGVSCLFTMQHPKSSHESTRLFAFDPKVGGLKAGTSDDDEPNYTDDGDKASRGSPWHRVKWTASMVRLLIHNVVLMGEDDHTDNTTKKKGGLLQKKGKWKAVSQMMNDRGCYVSPQQCEDKFNDLNKRYKRLNDILGKGTACYVVENPDLLDTMDNLSDKAKDNVRKILSSKHLFYREMCSYHTGCKPMAPPGMEIQPSVQVTATGTGIETLKQARIGQNLDENDDSEDMEEEEEEGEDDCEYKDDEADVETTFHKSSKHAKLASHLQFRPGFAWNSLRSEGVNLSALLNMQAAANLTPEQQQFLAVCLVQLEEQQINLQAQALELEKERFKWERLCSKKCWELTRLKEDNAKMKLENERMCLLLKEKRLNAEWRQSETLMLPMDLPTGRLEGREQPT